MNTKETFKERDVYSEAKEILGTDLNQSLHHLIGFWYATKTSDTFDTELASEMIDICLREMENPVGIDRKKITALEARIKELEKQLEWTFFGTF